MVPPVTTIEVTVEYEDAERLAEFLDEMDEDDEFSDFIDDLLTTLENTAEPEPVDPYWTVNKRPKMPGNTDAWKERAKYTHEDIHKMSLDQYAKVREQILGAHSKDLLGKATNRTQIFPEERVKLKDLWVENPYEADRTARIKFRNKAKTKITEWWQAGYT